MHELRRFDLEGEVSASAAAQYIGNLSAAVDAHSHAFLEIAVVLSGRARHTSAAGIRSLRSGSVVLVHPGEWHSYRDCHDLEVFNLYLFGDGAPGGYIWTTPDPLLRWVLSMSWLRPPPGYPQPSLGEADLDRTVRWFGELTTLDPLAPAAATLRSGLVMCVLGSLAPAFVGRDGHGQGPGHPAVVQTLRLMQQSLANDWTVTALADEVHVSPSHLSRLCRAQVGSSPAALLARLRAEAAALLLLEGGRSIAEIGRSVGYDDPAHFSRRFRQRHGMSPRTYQRRFGATATGSPAE